MAVMKRIMTAVSAALALALALPAVAPATLTEVGVLPATTPPTVPSCPGSPCLAVSRTTGFQVKVGTSYGFLAAPRKGSVVAWTIMLGKPNATQVKFFNANEGGEAEAGIAVLRPVRKPNLTYRLVAISPTVKLTPYFGKTAQFPLENTIAVRKGDVKTLEELGSHFADWSDGAEGKAAMATTSGVTGGYTVPTQFLPDLVSAAAELAIAL